MGTHPTNQQWCAEFENATATCTAFPCDTEEAPPYCGQDAQYAQYATKTHSFTCLSPTGTQLASCDATADDGEAVLDELTGLVWQRTAGTSLVWDAARESCEELSSLRYGGRDDWRMPAAVELSTLINYNTHSRAIDDQVFPDSPWGEHFSSTPHADDPDLVWIVDFTVGLVSSGAKAESFAIRCVAGEELMHQPSFVESGATLEEIFTDEQSGLEWQRVPPTPGSMPWAAALEYCENLTYNAASDWRLPNINELRSLVDFSQYEPATTLPGIELLDYWSSTTQSITKYNAWAVDFAAGSTQLGPKDADFKVRCVRGGN